MAAGSPRTVISCGPSVAAAFTSSEQLGLGLLQLPDAGFPLLGHD